MYIYIGTTRLDSNLFHALRDLLYSVYLRDMISAWLKLAVSDTLVDTTK